MRAIDPREFVGDMYKVIEEAEKLLHATAGDASDKVMQARAKTEKSLHDARRRLGAAEGRVLERAREAGKTADKAIRANPWQFLGIAAAVGLLAGVVLGRR